MSVRTRLSMICGVLAAWGALSGSAAQAQMPNYLYLYGMGRGLPYSYGEEHVPYYSLYPPVYYSAPVPRTYGYSPFAYPPGYITPEIDVAPAPQIMKNPHVVPDTRSTSSGTDDRTASSPKVIFNPFVEQRQAGEEALAARRPASR